MFYISVALLVYGYCQCLPYTSSHRLTPMTDQIPTPSSGSADLPPGVDEQQLEAFVRRVNAGVYDDTELEGLTAAVTVIEAMLDQPSTAPTEAETIPAASKWAAAAGYEQNASDDS